MGERVIIDTCAAYDVVEPFFNASRGLPVLRAGEELADANKPMRHYQIYSVISSALKDGDDPLYAYQRALERGHKLHFIYALGSSITAWKRDRKQYIGVRIGSRYWFEGHVFEITKESNDNLGLKLIPFVTGLEIAELQDTITLSAPEFQATEEVQKAVTLLNEANSLLSARDNWSYHATAKYEEARAALTAALMPQEV